MATATPRPGPKTADRVRYWAAVVAVVLAGLIAFLQSGADDRSFLLNLANALGFAAIGLMVIQLATPAGPRVTPGPFRPTLLLRLHGKLGYFALGAAAAHVLLLFVDDADRLDLLNVVDSPGRARAGLTALLALAVLTVAAQFRRRGRQSRAWRLFHLALSVVAAAFAVGHVFGVREYLGLDVVTGTALTLVALAAVVAVYVWPERAHG